MNTAAADFAATGLWVGTGLVALLLLVASCVKVVPEHQRVVVSRLGRPVRVRGPGLTFRLPVLEHLTTVSLHPVQLPLLVSATTRDGVPVRLFGTGLCRIADPSRTTSPDPLSVTTTALESALAKAVAHTDLAALLPARERFQSQLPRDVTGTSQDWGVEVIDIEVQDIETRLTSELLHNVHRNSARARRRRHAIEPSRHAFDHRKSHR